MKKNQSSAPEQAAISRHITNPPDRSKIGSVTGDIEVAISSSKFSPLGGKKAEYAFDLYQVQPATKKLPERQGMLVGRVIHYAGLNAPVLTAYFPSVHRIDRDRVIDAAKPGSSGAVIRDALEWPSGSLAGPEAALALQHACEAKSFLEGLSACEEVSLTLVTKP